MTSNETSVLKKLLIVFLVVAGLYFAKSFLIPLCIGAVLATLFLPLHKWLHLKKVPNGLSALICLLALLTITTLIFSLLGWQLGKLTSDVALLKTRSVEIINDIQYFLFNNLGISFSQQSEILRNEQLSVAQIAQTIFGSVASIVTNTILVLAYVFLLLFYRAHIKDFFLKLAGEHQQNETELIIHGVTHVSQEYLLGMTKMIFCLWVMYGIAFSALGVENALFFAILCGILEIVPYLGNLVGTILTLLIAAIHGASPMLLFGIVTTYATIQFIQGWILEPLILGAQVKINPLFTILALIIGQLVWGIPGVFLAIPIIAMVKIMCDHVDALKPYGFLIGEIKHEKRESRFILRIKSWFRR